MTSKQPRQAPQLRLYKRTGKGRVILSAQHFYTYANFGTIDATREDLALVDAWEKRGRQPLRRPRTATGIARTQHARTEIPRQIEKPKTVDELADLYLEHIKNAGRYVKAGRQTTQMALIDVALRDLKDGYGAAPLSKFGKRQLIRHRDFLETREEGRKLTTRGVNRKIALIKQCFAWADERGIVSEDCAVSVSALRPLKAGRKVRKSPVSDEHLSKILAHVPRPVAAMLHIQRIVGMRPTEVCTMRWADIDESPEGVPGFWLYTVRSKYAKAAHHGEETCYLLNADAQTVLAVYRSVRNDAYIFSPKQSSARARNPRYDKDTYRHIVQRAGYDRKLWMSVQTRGVPWQLSRQPTPNEGRYAAR